MKLTKIKIYGFGKWIDKEFDVDADYQIIFGQNEAGKTTLLTFIKSILFGFATNRGDNKYQQYKPKHASRYGGELEFDDGKSVWNVTRVSGKAGGDLTLFRDDQQVPVSLISKITSNFTKEEYENTHVLNEESIFSIYKMTEDQLETEIMSVGAVGSKAWLSVANEIENDSEQLYKSRGKKQPLVHALEKNQKLIQKKSEFGNQQDLYSDINQQISATRSASENNYSKYQASLKEQSKLVSLSKKWEKFDEYRNILKQDTDLPEPILTSDWEQALRINQEIQTLNSNTQTTSRLSSEEQGYLDFYHANKLEFDDVRSRRSELQQIQFKIDNLNQSLSQNDNQIDQLFANNKKLDEDMQILSSDELNELSDSPKQALNTPLLAIAAVSLLLTFFMSGFFRVAAGIVFLISIVSAIYQQKTSPVDNMSNEVLDQKGYKGLSVSVIKELQPILIQLRQLHSEQQSLEESLKLQTSQLNNWQVKLEKLNLTGGSTDFVTKIDDYFNKLNVIKAKSEVINSVKLESGRPVMDRINDLKQSLKFILNKYQVSNMEEFTTLRSKQQDKRNLINQLKADKEYLASDLDDLNKFQSFQELSDKLTSVNQNVQKLERDNDQLNRQLGNLKAKQEQVFDDREYQQVIDELTQNQSELTELYDEWLADKLASQWIREMLNSASENRYPKMINTAERFFNLLTSGNYIKIELKDDKLKLTSRDKTRYDVHELSKATTVQLYLSLRLAFIIEISDLVNLPILIDDAFVDFDNERTENIMELIKEISKTNQIIYVTAKLDPKVDLKHVLNLKEERNA